MSRFILILRRDPARYVDVSPADMQRIVERYRAWAAEHAGTVVREESNKLTQTGRMLHGAGGKVTVKDGPYAETKDVIGGFFMVEAPDYAAAVEVARTCPHIENGSIEVRQVDG
jgi:hypothetical protein